jgi:hypothetical protein
MQSTLKASTKRPYAVRVYITDQRLRTRLKKAALKAHLSVSKYALFALEAQVERDLSNSN